MVQQSPFFEACWWIARLLYIYICHVPFHVRPCHRCTVNSMDKEYTNLSAEVAKCRISVISRKDFDDILSQKTFPLSRPRQEDCLPQLVSPSCCPPLPPATMQRLRNFQLFASSLLVWGLPSASGLWRNGRWTTQIWNDEAHCRIINNISQQETTFSIF